MLIWWRRVMETTRPLVRQVGRRRRRRLRPRQLRHSALTGRRSRYRTRKPACLVFLCTISVSAALAVAGAGGIVS